MKVRKKRWLGSLLVVALVFGALLSACGTDQPTGVAVQTVNGVVTVGTPTVGLKTCTSCHTSQTSDWMLTKHANVEPSGNLYSAGNPTLGQIAGCTKNCHDSNGDGAGNLFTSNYTGNVARPVVGCESCHSGGSLHVAAGGAGPIGFATTTAMVIGTTSTLQASAQLRTCTGCHELLDPDDPLNTEATPTHLTSVPTGSSYIITDTHFATPGSFTGLQGANVLDVTGYSMDYASERVCIDCHNPHRPADINREWAQSRHADKTAAFAWAHYNWSCDDGSNCGGLGLFGSRTTCQRCHTTTGFAAYADALGAGNTALADSIWNGSAPPLTPYNPNFKPEMLECKGCHADNKGTVRNPGAYKASYTVPAGGFPPPFIMPTAADVSYQYPDISASNVCMPCHTGRMSGKALNKLNTGQTVTTNFGNLAYNTVDGHYLTAGGTVFKGTAYEYAGRTYADPSSYKHDDIGTPSAPNTGMNGPCVGCHMDRPGLLGNHLFEPVVKDGAGEITTVSSEVCFVCHAGSATQLGRIVEDEKLVFEDAISAFDEQLIVSGYTFTTTFPYFPYSNWLSSGDTDWTGNMTGKNNIGAAFNFSLLHHEPGAYVHNSRYVKRLIYDSIDWLDDNNMNYSVGTTLTTSCTSTPQAWCTGAKDYLLYGSPNTSGERP